MHGENVKSMCRTGMNSTLYIFFSDTKVHTELLNLNFPEPRAMKRMLGWSGDMRGLGVWVSLVNEWDVCDDSGKGGGGYFGMPA